MIPARSNSSPLLLLLLALLFVLAAVRQIWTFFTFFGVRNDSVEVLARVLPPLLAALLVGLIARVEVKRWKTALTWPTGSLLCFALGMLINDTLGHPTGDQVLREVARRLDSCVPAGALLVRLGGDEFMVVLLDLEPDRAAATAERVGRALLDTAAPAIRVGDSELFVATSVGMSLAPDDSADAVSLQRHADAAMYRAKQGGLGYHAFTPSLS